MLIYNYHLEFCVIDLAAWHNAQPWGFKLPPLFRLTQPCLDCSPCRSQPPTLSCVRCRGHALPDQGHWTGHGRTTPLAPSTLHSHHFWQLCVRGATLSGGQHSDHHPVQPTSPLSSTSPGEKTLKVNICQTKEVPEITPKDTLSVDKLKHMSQTALNSQLFNYLNV